MPVATPEQESNTQENGEISNDLERCLIDPKVADKINGDSYGVYEFVAEIAGPTLRRMRLEEGAEDTSQIEAALKLAQLNSEGQITDNQFRAFSEDVQNLYFGACETLFRKFSADTRIDIPEIESAHRIIEEHNTTVEQKMYERLDFADVMVNVTEAAIDRTVFYTYAPGNMPLRRDKDTRTMSRGGYETFGSGSVNSMLDNKLLTDSLPENPPSEFVQFLPVSSTSEGLDKTVRNPKTGKEEPGMIFRYKFKYTEADARRASVQGRFELPPYDEQSGRGQNVFEVATVLPESVAKDLQLLLLHNPEHVRVLVDYLVEEEGGLTSKDWKDPKPGQFGTGVTQRPPYDGLPNDWQISVIH